MRIVWKDSAVPETYRRLKYRGHYLTGTPYGWEISIPGDDNLYKNHYCAQNAIDKHLGGTAIRGECSAKRKRYGIQIVGKKGGEPA